MRPLIDLKQIEEDSANSYFEQIKPLRRILLIMHRKGLITVRINLQAFCPENVYAEGYEEVGVLFQFLVKEIWLHVYGHDQGVFVV